MSINRIKIVHSYYGIKFLSWQLKHTHNYSYSLLDKSEKIIQNKRSQIQKQLYCMTLYNNKRKRQDSAIGFRDACLGNKTGKKIRK